MEKMLVCDICGTSYADMEERCPTCGYARAFELESLYSQRPSVAHTKVRGGRYSKKNVQKRLQELAGLEKEYQAAMDIQTEVEQEIIQQASMESVSEEIIIPEEIVIPEEEVIVIPEEVAADAEETVESPAEEIPEEIAEEEQEEVEEAFPAEPAAEAIDFEFPEEEPQEDHQEQEEELELELEIPEEIQFVEEAPQEPEKKSKSRNLWLNLALGFASVVFALSALYLVITYAVPAVKEMLPATDPTVVATEAPTTEPIEAEMEEPTEAEEILILNFTTLTFTEAEDSSKVFAIDLSDREITWSSDNTAVASVNEAGLITAVGPGTTTIHAVYGEQEAVVTVTCDFE